MPFAIMFARNTNAKGIQMRLIGMLDSPYVRRVAISLHFMDVPFTHEPVSVFSDYDVFAAINPVVKAPTLVTDDGVVLMDSSLILDYAERLVPPQRHLLPKDIASYTKAQRIIGLSLAACEKIVQIVYEHELRPAERRHQPWVDRVTIQLCAAIRELEAQAPSGQDWIFGQFPLQPDITLAVAWRFAQYRIPDTLPERHYPKLAEFSHRAEALQEFQAYPIE
jgi:glutathione S-transferase